jgi:hypothetical protein
MTLVYLQGLGGSVLEKTLPQSADRLLLIDTTLLAFGSKPALPAYSG